MDNSSLTKPCYYVFLTLLSKKRGRSKVALWEMRFFIQEKSQKVPPPHIAGVALLPMNKITRTDNKTLPSVVWYAKSPFVIVTSVFTVLYVKTDFTTDFSVRNLNFRALRACYDYEMCCHFFYLAHTRRICYAVLWFSSYCCLLNQDGYLC